MDDARDTDARASVVIRPEVRGIEEIEASLSEAADHIAGATAALERARAVTVEVTAPAEGA